MRRSCTRYKLDIKMEKGVEGCLNCKGPVKHKGKVYHIARHLTKIYVISVRLQRDNKEKMSSTVARMRMLGYIIHKKG